MERMSLDALAARLVSAFAGHEAGLEEYLDGLRPDELHGLTALLESSAQRKVAVVPLLRSPRPANWRLQHYYFIAWSYVSLMSAAATEIAVRVLPLTTRGQVGLTSFALSVVTMAIAFVLIGRHRPPAETPPPAAELAQQSGVPS